MRRIVAFGTAAALLWRRSILEDPWAAAGRASPPNGLTRGRFGRRRHLPLGAVTGVPRSAFARLLGPTAGLLRPAARLLRPTGLLRPAARLLWPTASGLLFPAARLPPPAASGLLFPGA